MRSYLVLMRGPSPEAATMVAATANPAIVRRFADAVLAAPDDPLTEPGAGGGDAVEDAVAEGKREALRIVRDEAADEAGGGGPDGWRSAGRRALVAGGRD